MTDPGHMPFDDRLEAYLDEVMPEDERLLFEAELATNPQLAAEVALQARIDSALVSSFPMVVPSPRHLAAMERHFQTANDRSAKSVTDRRTLAYSLATIAAAACVGFLIWWPWSQTAHEPYFESRPVAQIYAKTVAEGFEPYYECRDDDRFAETFALRQGVPLRLTKLPVGNMMKGLSYPGGLSRQTTAMLCDISGKPVMVFVDREENDRPIAAENSDPRLKVFRTERDGLVFYEVTPLDEPTMTEHMVVVRN